MLALFCFKLCFVFGNGFVLGVVVGCLVVVVVVVFCL